jgi:hypothetical protein
VEKKFRGLSGVGDVGSINASTALSLEITTVSRASMWVRDSLRARIFEDGFLIHIYYIQKDSRIFACKY